MRIIRFQEELHSTNSVMFKKAVYNLSGVRPQDHLALIKKIEEYKRVKSGIPNPTSNFFTKITLICFFPFLKIDLFLKKFHFHVLP
jgi:hypothetical protein